MKSNKLFIFGTVLFASILVSSCKPSTQVADIVLTEKVEESILEEPKETFVMDDSLEWKEESFTIAFAEYQGQSMGKTCMVKLKGDSVIVMNDGTLAGKKGDVMAKGVLMKHKSGRMIIGNDRSDVNLDEVGGCTDGPRVIEIEKKIMWIC